MEKQNKTPSRYFGFFVSLKVINTFQAPVCVGVLWGAGVYLCYVSPLSALFLSLWFMAFPFILETTNKAHVSKLTMHKRIKKK